MLKRYDRVPQICTSPHPIHKALLQAEVGQEDKGVGVLGVLLKGPDQEPGAVPHVLW